MQISIHISDLDILRKAVSGLSAEEIAKEMGLPTKDVAKSLKELLQTTKSKDAFNAMQALAKQGFTVIDFHA